MNKYVEKFKNFILTKLLLLYNYLITLFNNTILFIKKIIDDYIKNASQKINKPNLVFFEKFYYNVIIFTYWSLLQLKNLLSNILFILKMEYKMIKIKTNESIFGNKKFLLSTPNLFKNTLENIPKNSNILDFGCGSGICYKDNEVIKTIYKSNLNISGIDIDKYSLIKFKKRIESNMLNNKIKLFYGDILTIDLPKYDYIIFSESAPLMSKELLRKVVLHMKNNLLNKNGKIIFINNLIENPQLIIKILKPNLKYFTKINFGRTLNKEEFDNLKNVLNMNVKYEKIASMPISEIASFFYLGYVYKLFNKLGFKNYDVEQYKITFENE